MKCPKDEALRELLDRNESHGRIVIAASFQGSIDRVLAICKHRGWAVACVDGRGWRAYDNQGGVINLPKSDGNPLIKFWNENEGKVAFVANPASARYGLTLTLAHTLVFFDQGFSAEHRLQMIDRIHRMTMDVELGANIYDLIHLPIDHMIMETLTANRKLELMSLGALSECLGIEDSDELLEEEIEP